MHSDHVLYDSDRCGLLRRRPLAQAIVRILAGGALFGPLLPHAMPEAMADSHLPLPQPAAVFATLGRANYSTTGTRGLIDQRDDRVILNWDSFDIGASNSVEFRQPAATSIALNRISGTARPSEILGELTANGQVYLYNPDGFVFGPGSRVNTNSLVVSSLDVSDAVFEAGITRPVESGAPAFTGSGDIYRRDGNGALLLDDNGQPQKISIKIAQGAKLATNAANGRILVLAPSVVNAGELRADDGQVILAAATDKVYLKQADSANGGVRGLLVEVDTGGDVTNLGQVLTARGNATLAGFAVNQAGRVSATTTVKLNGSIVLKATERATVVPVTDGVELKAQSTGRAVDIGDGLGTTARVVLGTDSLTEVALDTSDRSTAVDEQKQERSRIDVVARSVRFERGARMHAPSGAVNITATAQPLSPATETVRTSDATLELAPGSVIDVAGTTIDVPVERNALEVQLFSNELRDAPLQKKGVLYGKKITVDARIGTPLADVSGAVARIGRSLAERSTSGGSVTLQAAGDVKVNAGASLNVAGGAVRYLPGRIATTQLISADGRVHDISVADPRLTYVGTLDEINQTYATWGITRSWRIAGPFASGRYEPGYVSGQAGGQLTIRSPQLALDGVLTGHTLDGLYQRKTSARAVGSRLNIDMAHFGDGAQSIRFDDRGAALADDALVFRGSALGDAGFRNANFTTNAAIDLAAGTRLALDDGAELRFRAGSVHIDGAVDAVAGHLDIATLAGELGLGSQAELDVRGEWVNDVVRVGTTPVAIEGGSVSLAAQGDLRLDSGSVIDVSGGAWVQADGTLVDGRAGTITLSAIDVLQPASLTMDGELRAYALHHGGSLSLRTSAIAISATASGSGAGLILSPAVFHDGGFSDYRITADYGGLTLAADTRLTLQQDNFVLTPGIMQLAAARALTGVAGVARLPLVERLPVGLTLAVTHTAPGAQADAALRMESGSRIETDPRAQIALRSDSDIFVNGSIRTPAGEISLHVTPPPLTDAFGNSVQETPFRADQGIWIGDTATLSAAGIALFKPNLLGRREGPVLGGGTIALNADRGYIVLAAGARLDADGASGLYDEPTVRASGPGTDYRETRIGSRGGNIALTAAEGLVQEGRLSAAGGTGIGAGGGRLAVTLDIDRRAIDPALISTYPSGSRVIDIDANRVLRFSLGQGADVPLEYNGHARIDAASIGLGGFAALDLRTPGSVVFSGDVTLGLEQRLVVDAPRIVGSGSGTDVALQAAYVALGSSFDRATASTPQIGGNRLRVDGALLDLVGATVLDSFASVTLSSAGDIRLRGVARGESSLVGTLTTAADLTLSADQIYPTTYSQFDLAVQGNTSATLTIVGGATVATVPPVLSAGGVLRLSAPTITQRGVVKAPGGRLEFAASDRLTLAAGSISSVSLENTLVPFGRTLGGLEWIYPIDGKSPLQVTPPAKRVTLDAASVIVEAGATVDVRGGGELQAYEFIRGPGGSVDVLDPLGDGYIDGQAYVAKFAILPTLGSDFAPFDYAEFPASGLTVGDSIRLDAGSALGAGNYVLLPAHYALLPGAFLVTPVAGSVGVLPGTVTRDTFGESIVTGYRTSAGTTLRDNRYSQFVVEDGSLATTRSEYTITRAQSFYSARAAQDETRLPALPADAGSLSIGAGRALTLRGSLLATAAAGGRRGQVDIAAEHIALVGQRGSLSSISDIRVELVDDELLALGTDSLFIGGRRVPTATGQTLDVASATLDVLNGVSLAVPELLLGARERIDIADGVNLQSAGQPRPPMAAPAYTVAGDAAIVRLSSSAQADFTQVGSRASVAELHVAAGATLASGGSMNLLASGNAVLDGAIDVGGGALEIGALAISLGAAPGGTSGVVLSEARLNAFGASTLALSSGSGIDLYGNLALDFTHLELDAAGLRGMGIDAGERSIAASTITLSNRSGAVMSGASLVSGSSLTLLGGDIALAGGRFDLAGFETQELRASHAVNVSGDGALMAAGALTLTTPVVFGAAGADYRIEATVGSTAHALTLQTTGGTESTVAAGLGAKLALRGGNVVLASRILLPAGHLDVEARGAGGLVLAGGADIDVAGQSLSFADRDVHAAGGRVLLDATAGDVVQHAAACIDVSAAAGGGHAGHLSARAANGSIALNGVVDGGATTGYTAGSLELDLARYSTQSVTGLVTLAHNAGFSERFALRVRDDAIAVAVGTRIDAHDIALTSDRGAVTVSGTLDASGAQGGRITLAGGTGVQLTASAELLARADAVNERGGRVLIDSVGGTATSGGALQLDTGSRIDVTGGAAVAQYTQSALGTVTYGYAAPVIATSAGERLAGEVNLRARRTVGGLDASLLGNIVGAQEVGAEAVRIYDFGSASVNLTGATLTTLRNDTNTYMASVVPLGGPFVLRPGLELRTNGAMNLTQAWNLADWRYADTAGVLSLRAGGSLTLNASLGDAFKSETLTIPDGAGGTFTRTLTNALQSGQSWSYRLSGGADLASADVMASSLTASGDVTLANGALVRTGSGDIAVAASGNLRLADDRSAIYTAGRRLPMTTTLGSANPYGSLGRLLELFYAEYPIDGGDVRIDIGGNIIGASQSTSTYMVGNNQQLTATTTQFLSDWLTRTGANLGFAAWGIALDLPTQNLNVNSGGVQLRNILNARSGFRQNVGALAGGQVSITAGGDITNLSVMIPTTGKPTGIRATPQIPTSQTFLTRALEINGGGDLFMEAGGDIAGGMIHVDRGRASLRAGGSVTGGQRYTDGPVFALGDAQLEVVTNGDVHLGAVVDAGLLTQSYSAVPTSPTSYFLSYGADSAVTLSSLAGNVVLHNDTTKLALNATRYVARAQGSTFRLETQPYLRFTEFLTLYPGRLDVQALSGDVQILRSFNLASAARGSLDVLAAGDIATGAVGNRVIVNLSDAERDNFPDRLLPVGGFSAAELGILSPFDRNGLSHAAAPVHTGDRQPARLVSLHGDIRAGDEFSLVLAKRTLIAAGRDVRNLELEVQNLAPGDVTEVLAGRDIRYATAFDIETGALLSQNPEILIAGPGRLELRAGRDIDLGASSGVSSVGATRNPALTAMGASIGIVAGVSPVFDDARFVARYFNGEAIALDLTRFRELFEEADSPVSSTAFQTGSLDTAGAPVAVPARPVPNPADFVEPTIDPARHGEALIRYVESVTGVLPVSLLAAQNSFMTMSAAQRRPLLAQVFFDELRDAGVAAATTGKKGNYWRGLSAIDSLFPSSGVSDGGDVKLYFSKIHTLAGGGIDIFAPAGLVNAGLASSILNAKEAKDLGIVAQREGAVNIFSRDDVQVNQSRIFALGGDDITVWASAGDIDAGRGAKAALSVPPPIVSYDSNGNLRVVFPPAVSGSGIRTASTSAERDPGDVFLFAVKGIVDAGEAGIGGKNLVIDARAVVGAGNIDNSGTTIGVPTGTTVSVAAGLTGVGNVAASAAQMAEQVGSTDNSPDRSDLAGTAFKPTLLTAELVGFGDYSVGDIRQGQFAPAVPGQPDSATPVRDDLP